MLKRTYKKPEKGINYSKFVSDYSKQTGGNYKELLKDPKVKEMWKSRGKTVLPVGTLKEPERKEPDRKEPVVKFVVPNKVSNLRLTANNVIDNILLGKNVNDTGLERSYLQRVYNFLNSVTPTSSYRFTSADDYNIEPISFLFNNIGTMYIDSPFSWEPAVYAKNPIKMFPGKRELSLVFNDLNGAFDSELYRRFTNIKSEGDRTINYSIDISKKDINLLTEAKKLFISLKNEKGITIWYNDTFYTRKHSIINLIVYILYCTVSAAKQIIYVTDKDLGNNLTTFWKNLDIAAFQDLDFSAIFGKDIDVVNVINYLAGRGYQRGEQIGEQIGEQTGEQTQASQTGDQTGDQSIPLEEEEEEEVIPLDELDAGLKEMESKKEKLEESQDLVETTYEQVSEKITSFTEERDKINKKLEDVKSKLREVEDEYKLSQTRVTTKEKEINKKRKEIETQKAIIELKEKELSSLTNRKQDIEKEIAETKAENTALKLSTKNTEEENKKIKAEKAALTTQVKQLTKEKTEIETMNRKTEKEAEEAQENIDDMQDQIKILKDTKEVLEKESEADKKTIENLEKEKKKLTKEKNEIAKDLEKEKAKSLTLEAKLKQKDSKIKALETEKEISMTITPKTKAKMQASKSPQATKTMQAKTYLSQDSTNEAFYYDSQFNDKEQTRVRILGGEHKFAIHAYDDNKENKLERIKSYFKEEAKNLYYCDAVTKETDKRNLFKLGNKTADDIFADSDSTTVYLTIVGPFYDNLEDRLRKIGIDAYRKEIKKTELEETIFLGGGVKGGSYSRVTGGSVFDDVKDFLVYFNIRSMEKLPSIAKGKNTYMFSF